MYRTKKFARRLPPRPISEKAEGEKDSVLKLHGAMKTSETVKNSEMIPQKQREKCTSLSFGVFFCSFSG